MSATCNRCGDCCEVIPLYHTRRSMEAWFAWRPWRRLGEWRWAWWREWARNLWLTWRRLPLPSYRVSARFILAHWHEIPNTSGYWTCDQFDAQSRLCLAQETKPPVCSGYPWYGGSPGEHNNFLISRRCAYWADVAEADRPLDLVAFSV